MLLTNGADVNATDDISYSTALIIAAGCGQTGMAKFLIENGADVNVINNEEDTALMWAKWKGMRDIEKMLIEKGAVDYKSNEINNENVKEATQIINEYDDENNLVQIQCPNCGSYDIEIPGLGCLWWLGFSLSFFIIPFFILERLDNERKWRNFRAGTIQARCRICSYYFYIDQISSTQIKPNKRLLDSGHKKLEEERKRWYD